MVNMRKIDTLSLLPYLPYVPKLQRLDESERGPGLIAGLPRDRQGLQRINDPHE